MTTEKSVLAVQIGGDHYKSCAIQPVQYIEANRLEFLEGCVIKRVTRHNKPTGKGRQDIEKAIHELQLLLELRYPVAPVSDAVTVGVTAETFKAIKSQLSPIVTTAAPYCTRSGDGARPICGECKPYGSCKGI